MSCWGHNVFTLRKPAILSQLIKLSPYKFWSFTFRYACWRASFSWLYNSHSFITLVTLVLISGNLGPYLCWLHSLMTNWPDQICLFWYSDFNVRVKPYLPNGLVVSVMHSWTIMIFFMLLFLTSFVYLSKHIFSVPSSALC